LRAAAVAALLLGVTACVAPSEAPRAAHAQQPAPPPAAPAPEPSGQAGFTFRGAISQGGMVVGHAPSGTTALTLDGEAVPIAPDGAFLIAFGRDHGPEATLVATRADGSTVVDRLHIAPRQWHIEALPIPKYKRPKPEFLAIRKGELDQIHHARDVAVTVRSDGWRQHFEWPATGRVSGQFGAQRVYKGEKGSFHSGIDIAVPMGTPVRAPADGVVILAAKDQPFTLEGHLLMVGHGMGLDSAFLHLSKIEVGVGDVVRKGEIIGYSGMSGRATGPHLHWALTWRGQRIDPTLVAGPMPQG